MHDYLTLLCLFFTILQVVGLDGQRDVPITKVIQFRRLPRYSQRVFVEQAVDSYCTPHT